MAWCVITSGDAFRRPVHRGSDALLVSAMQFTPRPCIPTSGSTTRLAQWLLADRRAWLLLFPTRACRCLPHPRILRPSSQRLLRFSPALVSQS
eukprot:6175153-Pleurochrysis_carterae.AAC.2